jgi:hypothetical protein
MLAISSSRRSSMSFIRLWRVGLTVLKEAGERAGQDSTSRPAA